MNKNEQNVKERWFYEMDSENGNIKIHFIGDIISGTKFRLNPHRNPGYEICIIPYGRGFFSIENKKYVVKSNQIFMTRSDQTHYGMPAKEDPYRIYFLCFEIKKEADSIFKEIDKFFKTNPNPVALDRGYITSFFNIIEKECKSEEDYKKTVSYNLIESLILNVYRAFLASNSQDRKKYLNKNKRIERIVEYIEKNIESIIELDNIAKFCGYSKSYLCRIFKKETGFTIHRYINHLKIEKSRYYLINTDMTVTEISCKLGFKSIYHFSNLFKEINDVSPLNYRKNNS